MVSNFFNKKNIAIIIVLAMCAMFIFAPSQYITITYNSLKIFVANVLPCIFPFMFFTTLLTYLELPKDLAQFTKPLHRIYHTSNHSGYILVMSILCGYPISAKLISDAYDKHLITRVEVAKISSFTSLASSIFVIGTCGACLLSNKHFGYIIYISHLIGTLLNGLIYRSKKECINVTVPLNVNDTISDGMTKAIINTLSVGGFLVIVNIIIQFVSDIGLFSLITLTFGNNNTSDIIIGVVRGLFEMTNGVINLSQLHVPTQIILPLVTFIISFGGLSILLQTVTTLSNTGVRTSRIILTKFTGAVISTLICIPLTFIFN